MTTEEILIQRYGALISMRDCAELFCRSAEGFRITLARDNDFANKLRPAKIKIGRRVLFKTNVISKILDDLTSK